MAAHFVLRLITQPPQITVGEPTLIGYEITVPYEVSKPDLYEAVARPSGEADIVGAIEPTLVRFTLTAPWTGGYLVLRAKDEVWNESAVSIPFGFTPAPLVIERRDGEPGLQGADDLAMLGKSYSRGPLFR